MANWEYRVAYVDFRGRVSIEGQEIYMEKGERRSAFVRTVLDHLGKDGWELTGVHPLWPAETSYMVFKRPSEGKPESSEGSSDKAEAKPESKAEGKPGEDGATGEPTRSMSDDATEMV